MAKSFHSLSTGRKIPNTQSHAAKGKPSFKKVSGTVAKSKSPSMPGKVRRAGGPKASNIIRHPGDAESLRMRVRRP